MSDGTNTIRTIISSKEAIHFMQRLLCKAPKQRMSSFDDIRQHPWFEGFDWDALQQKTMPAPIVPNFFIPKMESTLSVIPKDSIVPPSDDGL